jgi:hypothetical protein
VEGHTVTTQRTLKMWDEIFRTTKAQSMLEIGFYSGVTAGLGLEHGLSVTSVDIGKYEETVLNLMKFKLEHPRFDYILADSKTLDYREFKNYDLLFVDGDHTTQGVMSDILLGVNAGIEWIVVDDYNGKWFGNIIRVVDFFVERGILKWMKDFQYDAKDGENTLVCLKNLATK